MNSRLVQMIAGNKGTYRHQKVGRHSLGPGMRARSSTACDVKVDRRIADLALFVSFLHPTIDLHEIDIANVNLSEASFQALPVPRITPQPASIATEHFIHAVAEEITSVFRGDDRLVNRNHLPIDVR